MTACSHTKPTLSSDWGTVCTGIGCQGRSWTNLCVCKEFSVYQNNVHNVRLGLQSTVLYSRLTWRLAIKNACDFNTKVSFSMHRSVFSGQWSHQWRIASEIKFPQRDHYNNILFLFATLLELNASSGNFACGKVFKSLWPNYLLLD